MMSDTDAQTGPAPDGLGSQGGGGDGPPRKSNVVGGTNAGVTNQTLLALDPSTFQDLHRHQARALNVVQLEFARDVAARTAQAYQQTIDVLGQPAQSPVAGERQA